MLNPIKQIHDFNHKSGLVSNGYNDYLECSMVIEEALEGLDTISNLRELLNTPLEGKLEQVESPKLCARRVVALANASHVVLSDVDRLDKACDQVVIAVGSMAKLGLTPNQITAALNVVMKANNAKLGCPIDSEGKLTKPEDWEDRFAPEPRLQVILDARA